MQQWRLGAHLSSHAVAAAQFFAQSAVAALNWAQRKDSRKGARMTPTALARVCRGRVHYAWIVLALVFAATLAGVGVRAAPGGSEERRVGKEC